MDQGYCRVSEMDSVALLYLILLVSLGKHRQLAFRTLLRIQTLAVQTPISAIELETNKKQQNKKKTS